MLAPQKKNHKRAYLIMTAAAILIVAAAYFGYAYISKAAWPFKASEQQSDDSSKVIDGINYGPPTEQEVTSSQDGKKQDQSPSSSTDEVNLDLAYAGKSDDQTSIEIRMFTTDIIEGDGTCTATLKKGSSTVSRQSHGFIDARSTICEPIDIPLDQLSAGTWNLTIEYSSPGIHGSKTGMVVQV